MVQKAEKLSFREYSGKGYYENPEMNAKHFFEVDGERAYRTGTWDTLKEIYCSAKGRIDFQIKLHGHRIE